MRNYEIKSSGCHIPLIGTWHPEHETLVNEVYLDSSVYKSFGSTFLTLSPSFNFLETAL